MLFYACWPNNVHVNQRSFSVIGAVDHSKEEVVTQDSDDDSPRRTNSSPAGALLESSSSTSQPLPPSVLQGPQGGLSTVSEEAITQQVCSEIKGMVLHKQSSFVSCDVPFLSCNG